MIELSANGIIKPSDIIGLSAEEMEQKLSDRISDSIWLEIKDNLEKMAFIDLHPQDDGGFNYEAAVVLCSKQDIITSAEIMAQKLSNYGLRADQIEDVLSTQTESYGGF